MADDIAQLLARGPSAKLYNAAQRGTPASCVATAFYRSVEAMIDGKHVRVLNNTADSKQFFFFFLPIFVVVLLLSRLKKKKLRWCVLSYCEAEGEERKKKTEEVSILV